MRMLLLAGTSEAVQIAHALSREDRVIATASLARAGRKPVQLRLPTRIGGWGGRAAFADWLAREGVDAVLDATHPFATRITARTAEVCESAGVSYIHFLRPQWTPGADDRWIFLNDEAEANAHIEPDATVLLATGHRRIDRFANLDDGRTVFVRVDETGSGGFPFSRGDFVVRPPLMSVAYEEALLHDLGIDWIVARNTGSGASVARLEAARRLGVPVAMIRRPPQPQTPRLHTIAEALAWVRRRL